MTSAARSRFDVREALAQHPVHLRVFPRFLLLLLLGSASLPLLLLRSRRSLRGSRALPDARELARRAQPFETPPPPTSPASAGARTPRVRVVGAARASWDSGTSLFLSSSRRESFAASRFVRAECSRFVRENPASPKHAVSCDLRHLTYAYVAPHPFRHASRQRRSDASAIGDSRVWGTAEASFGRGAGRVHRATHSSSWIAKYTKCPPHPIRHRAGGDQIPVASPYPGAILSAQVFSWFRRYPGYENLLPHPFLHARGFSVGGVLEGHHFACAAFLWPPLFRPMGFMAADGRPPREPTREARTICVANSRLDEYHDVSRTRP